MATIQSSIQLTDRMSSVIIAITNNMAAMLNTFEAAQGACDRGFDGSEFDALRQGIAESQAEILHLREELARPLPSPKSPDTLSSDAQWKTLARPESINNTGMSGYAAQMSALNRATEDVIQNQQRIGTQALQMDIIPPNAVWDINLTNDRVMQLGRRLTSLQNTHIDLDDPSASRLNMEIEAIRSGLSDCRNVQEQVNQAIESGDVSGLNQGYNQLNGLVEQLERRVRDTTGAMQGRQVGWQTPQTPTVISGTGLERYQQEIASANTMLQQLKGTQQQIKNRAASTNLFPPNMTSDLTTMGSRIDQIRLRIDQLSSRPVNVAGAGQASAQMESLRVQLSQAIQAQNNLNSAMSNMDISAANAAYNQLNSIVDSTERNIRDNVGQQEQFNDRIQQGTNSVSQLTGKIKTMVAAYVGIKGTGKVINLSDSMAQTTARLSLIVDDGGSVDALKDKIYAAAEDARGNFSNMSATVAKLGLLAGNAFSGNDELMQFTTLMNKQFVIGGASVSESTNAMYQLTQAMASGRLQGDEFRSIMENAPMLAQSIADYMGKTTGELREMSREGLITAEVIKNALFATADETNAKFASMPMTFEQIANDIKNKALKAFEPMLKKINDIANSPEFKAFVDWIITGFVSLANVALIVFNVIMSIGNFLSTHWATIKPILEGVVVGLAAVAIAVAAVTLATKLFSKALWSCPFTWIFLAIAAIVIIINKVVDAINKATGKSTSAIGIICGALAVAGTFIGNTFTGIWNIAVTIIGLLWNGIADFVNFFGNVFNDPVAAIIGLIVGLGDRILGVVQGALEALSWITFGALDYTDDIARIRGKMKGWFEDEYGDRYHEYVKKVDANFLQKDMIGIDDAWNAGYDFGDNLFKTEDNSPKNIDLPPTPNDPQGFNKGIAEDVSNIKDSVSMSNEDLKYLRDIAERDTINRFTTAEIKVDLGGVYNTVNKDQDLDGLIRYMSDSMSEQLQICSNSVAM